MNASVMPAVTTIELTREERGLVAQLLEKALSETRVEVHRTHTPAFRDEVQHEESVLRGLLAKLAPEQPPG